MRRAIEGGAAAELAVQRGEVRQAYPQASLSQ